MSTAPALALTTLATWLPPVATFGWMEVRFGGLVGFEGEDLAVSGVRLRGDLASLSGVEHLAGKAGEVADDLPGRWTARDVYGQRWVMLSPIERAYSSAMDEEEGTHEAEMAWREFDREVKQRRGRPQGMGSYRFRVSGADVIFWNGEWYLD